jgi:hypothetical protein
MARSAALAAAVLSALAVAAGAAGAPTSLQRYVASWAPSYRLFEQSYVKAFRPCLLGRPTTQCAAEQEAAAAAAARTAALLDRSTPPSELAQDVGALERDLRSAARTLSHSASAGRAGNASQRVWCSAEQGPCTLVMIDMGNVIGDINFTAGVDLPIPG